MSTLVNTFTQQQKELHDYRTGNRLIVIDGNNLSIPAVIAASRYGVHIKLDSSPAVKRRVKESVNVVKEKLTSGKSLYGISTGFGGSADSRTNDHEALSKALLQMQHCGVIIDPTDDVKYDAVPLPIQHETAGTIMPESWVKAAGVIRANSLIRGHSAVRWVLLERLEQLLQNNIVPLVPMRGSISASGDLSPLSYIAGALTGNPAIKVYDGPQYNRRICSSVDALASHNIPPLDFYPKEGLGLLNGTAFSAATASLILHEALQLSLLSQVLTALAHEALLGSIASHAEFIHEVCRPHPGQVEVSRNIEWLLQGSQLALKEGAERHIEEDKGQLRQDRYSLRTAPQYLGPGVEEILRSVETVTLECNSTTDNPLVDGESGVVFHGGNFQAMSVSTAMEKTRLSLAHCGKVVFAQFTEMLNPCLNRGLPPSAAATDPSLNYYAKGLDIAAAAYVAELNYLANPVSVHCVAAEMMNQSINSLALISARMTGSALDVLSLLMASFLLCLCQCLDIRAMQNEFAESFKEAVVGHISQCFAVFQMQEQERSRIAGDLSDVILGRLDKNTAMDIKERITSAVEACATILLQHITSSPSFKPEQSAALLDAVASFRENLTSDGLKLHEGLREAFLSGKKGPTPASHLLGNTRPLYEFVRKDLGIPMHGLANLHKWEGMGVGGVEGRTTGQNVSAIYKAIRRGHIGVVMCEMFSSYDGRRVVEKAKL